MGVRAQALPSAASPLERLLFAGPVLPVLAATAVVAFAASRDLVLGAAAVAACAAAVVVALRPVAGALALAALVPVLPAVRRGFPLPGLRLTEVLIVMVAAVVLVGLPRSRRGWTGFDVAASAYVGATFALGVFNVVRRGDPLDATALGELLGPLQFFLLYRTMAVTLTAPAHRRVALRCVFGASVATSAVALLQALDVGPTRDVIVDLTESGALRSWGFEQLARASGPFAAWHSLAGYLFVIIVLGAALLFEPKQRVASRKHLAIVLAAAALALASTLTMIAVLGVAAGLVVLGVWHGNVGRAVLVLTAGALLAVLLFGSAIEQRISKQFGTAQSALVQPARDDPLPRTVQYRIDVWREQYLPAMEGRYATGYGPGLPPGISWPHTESLYVTLLLRGGLPLLAVYAFLTAIAFGDGRRAARSRHPDTRAVAMAVTTVVVLLVPMHFIHPYFTDAGLPHLLWLLLGVLAAARAGDREREVDEIGDPR